MRSWDNTVPCGTIKSTPQNGTSLKVKGTLLGKLKKSEAASPSSLVEYFVKRNITKSYYDNHRATKHNAMQLINKYEHGNRGFYGGCIGYIGFDGVFNHAIMIRSIMSKDNVLYYQAGAGVVDLSVIDSEAQEVHNKLAALKKAIVQAVEV